MLEKKCTFQDLDFGLKLLKLHDPIHILVRVSEHGTQLSEKEKAVLKQHGWYHLPDGVWCCPT